MAAIISDLVSQWALSMGLLSLLRGSIVVALAVVAAPSGAATFADLYTVKIAPDPAATDREKTATQAAMARLLIRVTGSRNAPLEPALQPLIAAPEDFLTTRGSDREGRSIVGFRRGQVERVLTERGMRVWGPERPLTLLWIAVDDGAGGRALLGANEAAQFGEPATPQMTQLLATIREEVVAAADERGLPIAWPLLDLQDLNAVTFIDVSGRFDDRIVAASARYRADAVLIGNVRPGILGNEVDWLFVNGTERQALPVTAVRDGLDAAADRYAAELSTVGGASVAQLTVRDVRTPADYGRVMSYLERQSVLESVDVESYGDGTLSLRVAARGDARVLERVLALGGVLRPAGGGGAPGSLTFDVVGAGSAP
ncbi:MAG TPA: DUF2066 domain-containing protein [Gammaproteobacteria bacterium]|nr:DUF2066 domain-containing protein [Gammaproteobacteria bacterium]